MDLPARADINWLNAFTTGRYEGLVQLYEKTLLSAESFANEAIEIHREHLQYKAELERRVNARTS